ncbi:hypothetical protein [uncultured Pontibacter sp.]|uniref:hypothetical protein n=1 Tax=uncultured Pontibacter sp. TaxID=453356 RepID=UPI002619393F|nr:hypothetical protein [uncultured Pontibacter sp.]
MKTLTYLYLPLLLILLVSCDKQEDASPESKVLEITMNQRSYTKSPQEIAVLIQKPNPCYAISKVEKKVSGMTYSYNIVIEDRSQVCAAVMAEETVHVLFDPSTSGDYTLKFLINGKLAETRQVTVIE